MAPGATGSSGAAGGTTRPLHVLVFNDSSDVLETLTAWFEAHGHRATSAQLSALRNAYADSIDLICSRGVDVIVFDVAIPYLPNWDFLQALRETPALAAHPFVVTTPNKAALEDLVGEPTDALELRGGQDDLAAILRVVERNAGAQSV